MDDEKIIALYWERNEQAIVYTQKQYGSYCFQIAKNILYSQQDCEECVNDTWMRAWNSMPPQRPGVLRAFLGKITRNLSLDRYRKLHAKKRGEGEMTLVFDEITDEILPAHQINQTNPVQEHLEQTALTEVLNLFLKQLKQENRIMFVRRYWYVDDIRTIAHRMGCSESKVKSSLMRSRQQLKNMLEQEGIV